MKFQYKFWCICAAVATVIAAIAADRMPRIKVLLDEQQVPWSRSWLFQSADGFYLYYRSDAKTLKRVKIEQPTITASYKRKQWYVNGECVDTTRLMLVPINTHVTYEQNSYQGSIILERYGNSVVLINSLDLEDYVYAVLRTESWPGWPLEFNKVQAIACRSYVVSMIQQAKKQKCPYHVKNTNSHQTYTGHHTCSVRKQAVEDTRGVFLTHGNKPIRAMFDGCCGGIVPAHMEGVNFDDAPYLARSYACTHCKRCKIYSWRAQYSLSEVEQYIKAQFPHIKELHTVQIKRKDKAGIVQEAVVKSKKRRHNIPGKKLYSVFKDIKSFCFGIRTQPGTVIFEGTGRGHHLGLCQWGAREMVRDGWDHRRILQFYYPGTAFVKFT